MFATNGKQYSKFIQKQNAMFSLEFTSFEYVGDEIFSLDDGMMQFDFFAAQITYFYYIYNKLILIP